MLKVIVHQPPKPIGSNGWQQQIIGVHFLDAPGQESPFATPIPVLVGKGEPGFAPGTYMMDPASLAAKPDQFGKLQVGVGRMVLVPSKGRA